MSTDFQSIFARLRSILQKNTEGLWVTDDRPARYCLEGAPGPATLRAWGGKLKRPLIPVAWVEIGKTYVSYHLMGVYGHSDMSKQLKARMQGKTCFNFKAHDETLFTELEQLTKRELAAFRKAGFISNQESA